MSAGDVYGIQNVRLADGRDTFVHVRFSPTQVLSEEVPWGYPIGTIMVEVDDDVIAKDAQRNYPVCVPLDTTDRVLMEAYERGRWCQVLRQIPSDASPSVSWPFTKDPDGVNRRVPLPMRGYKYRASGDLPNIECYCGVPPSRLTLMGMDWPVHRHVWEKCYRWLTTIGNTMRVAANEERLKAICMEHSIDKVWAW